VLQVSVDDWPGWMEVGFAASVAVTALGGCGVTFGGFLQPLTTVNRTSVPRTNNQDLFK